MKNIGIMTFHNAHNYGSVLQAYALQTVVNEKLGYNSEIINYIPPNQKDIYCIIRPNNSIKNIARNILMLSKYKLLKKRFLEFDYFINEKIKLSNKVFHTKEELIKSSDKYDILICGSDQIWNTSIIDFNEVYFLTFSENAKKISYAPSIGGSNTIKKGNIENQIKQYLEKFNSISVREQKGKEEISKLTNKDIEVVLDPTLLLSDEDWLKVRSNRKINKEYILFYSIDYNDDAIKIVKKISKKLNLPVVVLYTTIKTFKIIFSGFEIAKNQAPGDFIELIKNSKLILSTSFHGTVFATIFKKPFYVVRGTYNGKINDDDRLTTFLKNCNLEERQIDINTVDYVKDYLEIDYTESIKNIENLKYKSINYLINSISGE